MVLNQGFSLDHHMVSNHESGNMRCGKSFGRCRWLLCAMYHSLLYDRGMEYCWCRM